MARRQIRFDPQLSGWLADRPAARATRRAMPVALASAEQARRAAAGTPSHRRPASSAMACLVTPSVPVDVALRSSAVCPPGRRLEPRRCGSTKNISSLRITEPLKSITASRRHTGPIRSAGADAQARSPRPVSRTAACASRSRPGGLRLREPPRPAAGRCRPWITRVRPAEQQHLRRSRRAGPRAPRCAATGSPPAAGSRRRLVRRSRNSVGSGAARPVQQPHRRAFA